MQSNLFGAAVPTKQAPSTPLTINLEEKISCAISREGVIETAELKGTLTVTPNTEAGQKVLIPISNLLKNEWSFGTHPKINKSLYESKSILQAKDPKKGFPLARPMGILRWTRSNADVAPITINCWPEEMGDGSITVNLEYECTLRSDLVLRDVKIALALGTSDPPLVETIDCGTYRHDPHQGLLCWTIDEVSGGLIPWGAWSLPWRGTTWTCSFHSRSTSAARTRFCVPFRSGTFAMPPGFRSPIPSRRVSWRTSIGVLENLRLS